jgi:hypothetical protein
MEEGRSGGGVAAGSRRHETELGDANISQGDWAFVGLGCV